MGQNLLVDVVTGPGQIRRDAFDGSSVVFGRDATSQIVILEKTASRKHGELKVVDGRWVLINHSPNGTNLNGRSVSSKPVAIKEKDKISIGDTVVFEIIRATVDSEEHEQAGPAAASVGRNAKVDPEQQARDQAIRKQRRLLIFGSIYAAGLLGLILFFLTLGPSESSSTLSYPTRLSDDEIRRIVAAPAKLNTTPDAQESRERLLQAGQLYERLANLKETGLYQAYLNYKLALAHANSRQFDGRDHLRQVEVTGKLTTAITHYYNQAYEQMRAGQYLQADENARKITVDLFPEPGSELHRNVTLIRQLCIEQIKKRRGGNFS